MIGKPGRHPLSLMLAVMSILALAVPVSAMDMSKGEHQEKPGQMMGMDHGGRMDRDHGNRMDRDHGGRMGNMMGMCLEHAEEMGLTETQIAKMKATHRDIQRIQAKNEADRKIAEIDLKEVMEVKDFNLDLAGSLTRRIADTKTADRLEMLKGMKEMRSMLSDEQFKTMQKMMPMRMGGDQDE